MPAAMQLFFEVGVFAAATTLIARLGADALAAHQVAMNAASFTYMVPLGIGAAAVRVGQALGRWDVAAASRSGWTATLMGAGFMGCAGIFFLLAPKTIVRIEKLKGVVGQKSTRAHCNFHGAGIFALSSHPLNYRFPEGNTLSHFKRGVAFIVLRFSKIDGNILSEAPNTDSGPFDLSTNKTEGMCCSGILSFL